MKVFYTIPRTNLVRLLGDVCIISVSWAAGSFLLVYPDIHLMRYFFDLPAMGMAVGVYIIFLYIFQVYRILWQYARYKDYLRFLYASLAASLFLYISMAMPGYDFPIAQHALVCILAAVCTVNARLFFREGREKTDATHYGISPRILIAGAGEAGRLIVSEFYRRKLGSRVVAFIDDDKKKIGTVITGIRVLGPLDGIGDVMEKYDINEIIMAMPSVAGERVQSITALAKTINPEISIKTLPPITRLFDNLPLIPDLEESSLAGILDREEYEIDLPSIEGAFSGKTVLVTGAGGSIGSELCKQVLKFRITKLVALGRGEHSMYMLIKSLEEYADFFENKPQISFRIADVRDLSMLDKIFKEEKPDIVFHAAAHKHVPLMECNEAEALINNVCGSDNVLHCSLEHAVERFVLVSTDKAVKPVNIMGASKRIAELLTDRYGRESSLKTAAVRFGNVLGSRGSVIPLFIEQIRKGGPVTVTHEEVTRYFMSIPEAALLVIHAAALCKGGETFVLDMGRPYRISDLAKKLIAMQGFEPGRDIPIEYTGLRPGEKLYEELSYSQEDLIKTDNEKIHVLKHENGAVDSELLTAFLDQCRGIEHDSLVPLLKLDPFDLRKRIKEIVPEYSFDKAEKLLRSCNRLVK